MTITITEDPLIPLAESDSYCFGDSVQVYGVWYSSAGTYQDTLLSTTGGCDTAVTITITEDALINSNVSGSYCFGDSVQVYGVWYSAAGSYQDTIASTTGGCDTAVTITITEDALIPLAVSDSYCFGDSVQVYGVWYSSTGTYQDTLINSTGGCDTAVTITITEDPLIPLAESDSYCFGDSVQVYGVWYSSAGTYQDTLLSTTGGCDTAVTITITEDPLINNSVSDSYCFGDSVQVYGVWYSAAGSYQDTIASTTGGCDTAVTITITEDALIPLAVSDSYCFGDSVQVYGVWYSSTGTYQDTLINSTGGCDTAVTITITEDPLIPLAESDSYCFGDSVQVYGVWYSSAGTYQDTLLSSTGGCDTAVTITITEDPLINNNVNATYCFGDSVQVYGVWYNTAGTYSDTIVSTTGGCDTAVTITVTEDALIPLAVSDSYCFGDSVQVYGVWYNSAGTYQDTLLSSTGGCDTAVTITITEDPLIPLAVSDSYCYGDSVQVYGVWYNSAGTYQDTLLNSTGGCDTAVTITITEDPLINNNVNATYCFGDSVQVYGVWYNAAGSYSDTIVSTTGGCDTAVTITISEDALIPLAVSDSYCFGDSVQVYGVWYNSAGTYQDTLLSSTGGCDTAVTITITEDPLIPLAESDSYCFGDSVQVYGVWYSSAGTYQDTLLSSTGGCDTAVTITITEDPLINNSVNATYCFGDSVQVYGVWYSSAGTYSDTIVSTTGGCDTAVTITVTEDALIPLAVSDSYCFGDSVQVYGIWYNSAGTYQDTLLSSTGGCDTALTITITEDPLIPLAVSDSYCYGDSIQIYGVWYNSAGTYQDTLLNSTGGCDTAVTITITEDPLINNNVNATYCFGDSVQVYGVWYNAAGTYFDTIASATGGCDTAATITITEDALIPLAVSDSYCFGDSVQVYGVWYNSAGTYQDTLLSSTGGCDTAVTITITEDPLIPLAVSDSYCFGDSVQVYGMWYSSAGTYQDTLLNSTGGCDTAVTITITEDPLIPLAVSDSYCLGDSVQVYGVWYSSAGTYQDTLLNSTGGCDTAVTITITEDPLIPLAVSDSYCLGDSVQVYGVWYSSAGTYQDTLLNSTGGCDTAVTITITEDPLIPLAVSDSYCLGDSVQVYGVWYSSAGTYQDTLLSSTGGCDTAVTITITEDPLIPLAVSDSYCFGDSVQVRQLCFGTQWYMVFECRNIPGYIIEFDRRV